MVNLIRARRRTDFSGPSMQCDEEKCTTPTVSNNVLCTHIIDSTKVVRRSPSSSLAASSDSNVIISVDGLNPIATLRSGFIDSGLVVTANGPRRLVYDDAQLFSKTTSPEPFVPPLISSHMPSLSSRSLPSSLQRFPSAAAFTPSSSAINSGSISPPPSTASMTKAPSISTSVPTQASLTHSAGATQDSANAPFIPWAALGAIIALIIVAALLLGLLWPRIKPFIHYLRRTRPNVTPALIDIDDSCSQATDVNACDGTLQTCHLVSTQRPVSIGGDMGISDIVSSRATRGSARSMSMYSHHTGITEMSRVRASLAMAEWTSVRPLPVPPVCNPVIAPTEASVEEAVPRDDQSHVEVIAPGPPDAEVAVNEDPEAEESGFERGQEEEAVEENRFEQPDRRSTAYHRLGNMSISSGSIATIMTDPPPPYSPNGEPFNPEEFDLSRIIPRRADADGVDGVE